MGDAPPHYEHQHKTERQEKQARDAILHADHLMIGREDVFIDEIDLVVVMMGIMAVIMSMIIRVLGWESGVHGKVPGWVGDF
jgi:hypothetical protein